MTVWMIPLLYAAVALLAGLTLPQVETRLFPGRFSPMSVSSAVSIYSAIASGMMALRPGVLVDVLRDATGCSEWHA
jgi:hypothetical protein